MEYTNKSNIELVVSLLKENAISDVVISPGGTNIPFVKLIQDDEFFECHSVVDERSAAYLAIGIYLQKHKPVVILCTSAQATRNYVPGLTEAYYKKVPILALTMEKHPRFKYQEYMQAPDQTSLPNDCVKNSYELPFISDINDFYHSVRLANEAIIELNKDGKGPVQLCVPWLDFPLSDVVPDYRTIKHYYCNEIKNENLSNKKILIVIGEHIPFLDKEIEAITTFCEKTNSVVYVNHLSNFSNDFSVEGNHLLLCSEEKEIKEIAPDILISIGGQTGDYPFYLSFSNNKLNGIEHWRVCEDGNVVDTYDKLTRVYQGSILEFFASVNSSCESHTYYSIWKEKTEKVKNNFLLPFSNGSIAQYLHDKIPENSIIQFSILNSLRIWNMFSLSPTIQCFSNVGAFGIDGGMSTLIGQSLVTEKLCFMIIGDLAFFYDMNVLGIRHIKNNVRILLINNNGGIEFKLHGEDKEIQDRYIAAANHRGSACGWAESCGFEYIFASDMDEFKTKSKKFISPHHKPILFEVFVNDEDEMEAYQKLVNENKQKKKIDIFKLLVKQILGENLFGKLKKVIKE